MKIYKVHYLPKGSTGDLLHGWGKWREALLLLRDGESLDSIRTTSMVLKSLMPGTVTSSAHHSRVEERMVDKESGIDTGETLNYCLNPNCRYENCGPAELLFEC